MDWQQASWTGVGVLGFIICSWSMISRSRRLTKVELLSMRSVSGLFCVKTYTYVLWIVLVDLDISNAIQCCSYHEVCVTIGKQFLNQPCFYFIVTIIYLFPGETLVNASSAFRVQNRSYGPWLTSTTLVRCGCSHMDIQRTTKESCVQEPTTLMIWWDHSDEK